MWNVILMIKKHVFYSTEFCLSLKARMALLLQVNYNLILTTIVFWFEIASDTYWFNWILNSLILLLWSMIRNDFILNAYWTTNVITLFWLIIWWKCLLDLCITSLCEMCEYAEVYIHIWDCDSRYCAINNTALDYRTVKEEGSFRANVVEGLAFKCA